MCRVDVCDGQKASAIRIGSPSLRRGVFCGKEVVHCCIVAGLVFLIASALLKAGQKLERVLDLGIEQVVVRQRDAGDQQVDSL